MTSPERCLLIIFGASGDLTKRKLIPALYDLFRQQLLPRNFAVLGISRTNYSDQTFRDQMMKDLEEFAGKITLEKETLQEFIKLLYYQSIDTKAPEDYALLKSRLQEVDVERQISGNYIFYLATPPSMYEVIASSLAAQGLHKQSKTIGWKRIVVEKPFGYDVESAIQLNKKLQRFFNEDQIYRID